MAQEHGSCHDVVLPDDLDFTVTFRLPHVFHPPMNKVIPDSETLGLNNKDVALINDYIHVYEHYTSTGNTELLVDSHYFIQGLTFSCLDVNLPPLYFPQIKHDVATKLQHCKSLF